LKKLKIILHSNFFLYFLFILAFLYISYSFCFLKSHYIGDETVFRGVILSKKEDSNKVTLEIKALEKLLVTCYEEENIEQVKQFQVGDIIEVKGTLSKPSKNSNFNLFNYETYLKGKQIFWLVNASHFTQIKKGNIFYQIKSAVINRIKSYKNSSFLMAFILGDSSYLEEKTMYQELGISHLFAVSGMHVAFLTGVLFWIGSRISKKKLRVFFLISILLGFYIWLLYDSASANRAYLLFLFSYLNKHYKFGFSSLKLLGFVFLILIFRNPFVILQTGFLFSFLICFFLMIQKREVETSYLKMLFMTSLLASIISFPLSVYEFHQFYFGSIMCNMIAVPFVSFLLFPLSFLCFVFPCFHILLTNLISFFHFLLQLFSNLSFLKVVFKAVPIFVIILYYCLLLLAFKHSKKWLILFFIFACIHFSLPYLDNHYYIDMIDVGQGDSILIRFPHLSKIVLIDTGGRLSYGNEKLVYTSQVDTILLPYFKTLGVTKIDVLILTHGDYDHMGNAINLVNNFKVENVVLNCGSHNDLENEFIKVLNKKKMKYYSCMKELTIKDNKFYFLNTKEYDNENDNSIVIYTELNHYKFLFMGDASSVTEKEILSKYNLANIDVLKVGHHGSKTSSSKKFIDAINPKYSLISVGKNNRYGHPNKEVLDILSHSKIYRTDLNGGIEIKLNKNSYKIKTCSP